MSRYERNKFSKKEQKKLKNAKVVIFGCGGLGGGAAESLVRIGVGKLLLVDFDVFEMSNLNRQMFSTSKNLGKLKAKVLKKELKLINPDTRIQIYTRKIKKSDLSKFADYKIWLDCLDDISLKLALSKFCNTNNINLIHAAIGGDTFEFSLNYDLSKVYQNSKKGIEKTLGNQVMCARICSNFQASEAVKLILNKKQKAFLAIGNLGYNELEILRN